jgi:type I restriction-modification system DNA methylase subunit
VTHHDPRGSAALHTVLIAVLARTLYDPAAGTGGMLSVAEEYLREPNVDAELKVYGQELNSESYAICKSDMMIKGQDPWTYEAAKMVFHPRTGYVPTHERRTNLEPRRRGRPTELLEGSPPA